MTVNKRRILKEGSYVRCNVPTAKYATSDTDYMVVIDTANDAAHGPMGKVVIVTNEDHAKSAVALVKKGFADDEPLDFDFEGRSTTAKNVGDWLSLQSIQAI